MEAFSRAVALEVDKHLKSVTSLGKVESVIDNTCTVKREGRADLLDVRIGALEDKSQNYFQIIPKVGSEVVTLEIENEPSETLIVGYSEIERIETKIGSLLVKIENDKIEISDGHNTLGNLIDDLINAIQNLKVQTPSGVGTIMSDSILLLNNLKTDFKNILK